MQQHLQIESYRIPEFYRHLNRYGVTEHSPRDDYEVYYGRLEGGEISIRYTGAITYTDTPEIQQAIDYASEASADGDHEHSFTRYAVLAQHPQPGKELMQQQDHLNAWLTIDQFYGAIKFFEEDRHSLEIQTTQDYEERVFERYGKRIEFHGNGKVISEDGYQTFAPVLREAILEFMPFGEYDLVIGQDEVGNGELLGPLVISSVGLTPTQMVELQLAGIKDSKMVPNKVAESMSQWIREQALVLQNLKLNPHDLNRMGDRSMVDILNWGHNKVGYAVLEKLQLDETQWEDKRVLVVVDQFNYDMDLLFDKDPIIDVDVQYLPGGEQYCVSVAAASVMAKALRYRWKQYYERIYDLKLNRNNLNRIRHHPAADKLLRQ